MSSKTIKILGHDFSDDHHLVKPGRSMHDGIDLVKCIASESYKRFSDIDEDKAAIDCKDSESHKERMYYEYASSMEEHKGSKYIKISHKSGGRSVHCFIVNSKNDAKFKYGDILKSATWKSPARNFARGNVIDDTVESLKKAITWTGVNY